MIHNSPPIPKNETDRQRWEHTRLRRRLLYGSWSGDLETRLKQQIGNIRRAAWGTPDLSSNVFRSVVSQLAVLYDRWPAVTHPTDVNSLTDAIEAGGLWPLMSRVQRDLLGLREMLIRVDVTATGELVYRPVFPDMVLATSHADKPDQPVSVKEARQRTDPQTGRDVWTWDLLDISDPLQPIYKVLSDDGAVDLTALYLGADQSGAAYPYRTASGDPVLPYVMLHAARTASLFDAYEQRELVEGSLNCAVLWSFFAHCVRAASWPQRYAIGVEVSGTTVSEDGSSSAVVTDPATVIMFRAHDEGGQPMIGQWSAGADPDVLQTAISQYERRVASYSGINPADLQRVSGDPRSGYAIAISREAQREAQRRFEPVARVGDLQIVRLSAILLNRATGTNHPESGYRITYEGVPMSSGEQVAQRDQLTGLMAAGLLDRISAYQQLHPGITRGAAFDALVEIADTDELLRSATTSVARLDKDEVSAAADIITAASAGEITTETARAMLAALLPLTDDTAQDLLSDVTTPEPPTDTTPEQG